MAVQALSKKGRKKWYTITASSHFNERPLGETLSYEPEQLTGRVISTNLSNLTGNLKAQNIKVSFRIKEIQDNHVVTEFIGYEMSPSYLKRVVRTGRDRVDLSFSGKTKDGVKVIVKPFLLTKFNTHRSVKTVLKEKCRAFFEKYFSETEYHTFVSQLISNKINQDMREALSKLYPLGNVEIRAMKRAIK
ncbi:hypothetical protein HY500_03645 [Candidatus Woesearchaeota archaeon]|nr:hypothetical protein [Candidatus Woesearchaeota archaeon]